VADEIRTGRGLDQIEQQEDDETQDDTQGAAAPRQSWRDRPRRRSLAGQADHPYVPFTAGVPRTCSAVPWRAACRGARSAVVVENKGGMGGLSRCGHRKGGARWLHDRHERHGSVGISRRSWFQHAFEDKDLVLLTPIALVQ